MSEEDIGLSESSFYHMWLLSVVAVKSAFSLVKGVSPGLNLVALPKTSDSWGLLPN